MTVVVLPESKLRKPVRKIGKNQNAIFLEPDYDNVSKYSGKNEKSLSPEERKEMFK